MTLLKKISPIVIVCILIYSCNIGTKLPPEFSFETDNTYLDSFTVNTVLYKLDNSFLIETLDSIIEDSKSISDFHVSSRSFPPYFVVSPFLRNDTSFFSIKFCRDYLFDFDPPDIEFSHKVFEGFGVAKHRGYLIRLNGKESSYITTFNNKKTSSFKFYAYGLRSKVNHLWTENLFSFIRYYVFLEDRTIQTFSKEIVNL